MRARSRLLASFAALAVAAGTTALGAASAQAVGGAGVPYRPDPHSVGSLAFYNASGTAVTSGTVSDHPFVSYAMGSASGPAGNTLATLYIYTPQEHVDPLNWSGDAMNGTNTYPVTGAGVPTVIKNSTKPVAKAGVTDLSLSDYIGEFPNNLTGDYAGLYEVRLVTSKPATSIDTSKYFSVDIKVTGSTWAVVAAASGTATATSLTASPKGVASVGSSVTLKATVTPKIAGSVEFFDGATSLGTGTYSASTGIATKVAVPATVGTHSYNATFTPTDTGTYNSSSSTVLSYEVLAKPTSVSVTFSPKSPSPPGTAVTFTATVSPKAAGSVKFLEGLTAVGSPTYNAGTGVATLTISPVLGDHTYVAQFTSTDPTFASSESAPFKYGIKVPSKITAKVSPAKTIYGHSAKVTVTIVATGQKPTGIVHVKSGATVVGTGVVKLGKATITVSKTLSVGPHTLTIAYLGDNKVGPSSTSGKLTVGKAKTTVTAKLSPTSIKTSGKATLSITVSAYGVKPTGKVTIKDGTKTLKTLTLKGGKAKFVLTHLKAGTHKLTVTYAGAKYFIKAKGKTVTLTVHK